MPLPRQACPKYQEPQSWHLYKYDKYDKKFRDDDDEEEDEEVVDMKKNLDNMENRMDLKKDMEKKKEREIDFDMGGRRYKEDLGEIDE